MRRVNAWDIERLRPKAERNLLLAAEKIDLVTRYQNLKEKVTMDRYTLANLNRLKVAKAVRNKKLEMLEPRRFRIMCVEPRPKSQQLAHEPDTVETMLEILAVINEYAEKYDSKPIVVGKSAVAIYTFGGHTERIIELVFKNSNKSREFLYGLGFDKVGKHWYSEDLNISLAIKGQNFQGDINRVVEFEVGKQVLDVIGYEDLIIDSLYKSLHWGAIQGQEDALAILLTFYDFIDLDYLRTRAKEEKVIGLLEELLEEVD